MRFATVMEDDGPAWAIVDGEDLVLPGAVSAQCRTVAALVARGPETAKRWGESVLAGNGSRRVPLAQAELGPPLRPARNVMCLGLNYAAHARESLAASNKPFELPKDPVVFTKAPQSITGDGATIPLDERTTTQLDWEVELGVIIGRGGAHIPEAQAMSHVFGYTVINDISARDLQFRHKQFYLGKSVPGGCPMGPWLVTADEITDPHALDIRCAVNGVTKQASNTSDLIFKIPRIIHLLSTVHPLEPGDVIATGTPEGVGFARKPPEFLQAGDEVTCTIEGVGTLRNSIGTSA